MFIKVFSFSSISLYENSVSDLLNNFFILSASSILILKTLEISLVILKSLVWFEYI